MSDRLVEPDSRLRGYRRRLVDTVGWVAATGPSTRRRLLCDRAECLAWRRRDYRLGVGGRGYSRVSLDERDRKPGSRYARGNESVAEDASAGGAVVVGQARNRDQFWRAFSWTAAAGIRDLGSLGGSMSAA